MNPNLIDLPPVARKIIYLVAAVGSLTLTYLGASGRLGGAEIAYGTGIDGLLFTLAAGKTDISKPSERDGQNDSKPVEQTN